MVDIQLVEGLEEEVVREKLETSPNFKVGEYGIQLRFVQKDKIIGIHGFCLKNFAWPDEPENARWGKVYVQLATLQKTNENSLPADLNENLSTLKILSGIEVCRQSKLLTSG